MRGSLTPSMKHTLEIGIEQALGKVGELFGGEPGMTGCFKKESLKYMTNFKAFAETGADVRESEGGA